METTTLKGTKESPWVLKTPPLTNEFEMYRDEEKKILVCTAGQNTLHYDLRIIDDLYAMLKERGDWVDLGSTDEHSEAKPGTVEAWARASDNPIGGWYGLKTLFRGRVGMYLPPLLEELGLAEVEHNPRSNRMRAI